MKKITLILAMLLFSIVGFSQCTVASSGNYPADTVAINDGVVNTIATDNWASEYSVLTGLTLTEDYQFSVTEGGVHKYVTVVDAADGVTVLSHGPSPFTVNAITVTAVWLYWTEDAACTESSAPLHLTTYINLTQAPICGTPSGLAATPADLSADLSWSAPAAGTPVDYNWEVVPQGNAQGVGVITSGTIVATMDTASGLTAVTPYSYYVQTNCGGAGTSTYAGPFDFTTTNTPPGNDDCSNAIALTCSSVTPTDTTDASLDTDDVLTCGPASAAGNIWYTYTGPGTAESIELSMCNDTAATPGDAAYDSKIYVYASGDGTCGTLVCEANNDDGAGCGAFSSIVNFISDGTTTYYIAISGFGTDVGAGNLSLTCTPAVAPNVANQDCGTAVVMAVDGVAVGTDNENGTVNISNPSCDGFGTIQDVWFSFVAPASGMVTVDSVLDGTATDANFVVYSGVCGALAEVATSCQDVLGTANTVALTGLSGTYYLQAWNGGGAEEGTFSLRLSDTSLGIEDLMLTEGFNMFPNPVKDVLTVSAKNEIKKLSVVNMLGQIVKTVTPNNRDYELDLSNLTSGIYFVKASVNNTEGTFRIVKK